MAQIGTAGGAVDAIADDRGTGIEQDALTMGAATGIPLGIEGGEFRRLDDRIGLRRQERQAGVRMGFGQRDHGACSSVAAGLQNGSASANDTKMIDIRNTGCLERREECPGFWRRFARDNEIGELPLRRGQHRIRGGYKGPGRTIIAARDNGFAKRIQGIGRQIPGKPCPAANGAIGCPTAGGVSIFGERHTVRTS